MFGWIGVPRDHEWELGIGLSAANADLAPFHIDAVGSAAVSWHRMAADASFDFLHVVDGDDPAEPPAASFGTCTDDLAECRLLRSRMIEHLDDFEVHVVLQRHDHVAGSEAGVDTAVIELRVQSSAERN